MQEPHVFIARAAHSQSGTQIITMLNIYKVVWPKGCQGYNRYLSFLVVCETEEQARSTHPNAELATGGRTASEDDYWPTGTIGSGWPENTADWIPYSQRTWLEVVLIGTAAEGIGPGVVIHAFLQG